MSASAFVDDEALQIANQLIDGVPLRAVARATQPAVAIHEQQLLRVQKRGLVVGSDLVIVREEG